MPWTNRTDQTKNRTQANTNRPKTNHTNFPRQQQQQAGSQHHQPSSAFAAARSSKDRKRVDASSSSKKHQVFSSLLHLKYSSDMEKRVEDAISAMNPKVFANRDSAKHFLSAAKTDLVVVEVVKRVCPIIPWDKELARLAARRCNDGDYTDESEDNLADVELERIYKGCGTYKFHLPLGMLSSHIVTDAVRQWPEFMNKCYCAFVATCDDDSILLMEKLKYCGHILESVELSRKLIAWLNHMIHRIMTDLQGIDTFQTLLAGIAVAESGAPLACLKGNDETSIALKRHIAGFHGVVLGKTKQAELKKH